jgi:hypothetical protein
MPVLTTEQIEHTLSIVENAENTRELYDYLIGIVAKKDLTLDEYTLFTRGFVKGFRAANEIYGHVCSEMIVKTKKGGK